MGNWATKGKSSTPRSDDPPRRLASPQLTRPDPLIYQYQNLYEATEGFSSGGLLGMGRYCTVHQGLDHNKEIVVRRLIPRQKGPEQLLSDYRLLHELRHPNIVELVGWCCEEGHQLLVYGTLGISSLAKILYKGEKKPNLPGEFNFSWMARINIAIDVAKALVYLNSDHHLFCGGLKASNIILDKESNAKLSVSNLIKIGIVFDYLDVKAMKHQIVSAGYSPPELADEGVLTLNCDVYSYGVLLLELVTGYRATQKFRESNRLEWAKKFLQNSTMIYEILDKDIEAEFKRAGVGALLIAFIISKCINDDFTLRHSMTQVLRLLEAYRDSIRPIVST